MQVQYNLKAIKCGSSYTHYSGSYPERGWAKQEEKAGSAIEDSGVRARVSGRKLWLRDRQPSTP